jgi:general secretion pathway protein D
VIARLARSCIAVGLAATATSCEGWPGREASRAPSEAVSASPYAVGPRATAPSSAPTALVTTPAEDEPTPVARVIQRGTGLFAQQPESARSRASIATDAAGAVTLNVVDAELREVVRMVLEDALGANYVIDPAVGGRITIQTTHPLPPEDLVPTLDAVLRMNGAALVQSGDLFQVVPIDRALSSGPIPGVQPLPGARLPGFSVVVTPLRFTSASAVAATLEPFAASGGTITPDPARNLLLLAGSGEQIATLQELVTIFDVDWMRGMSFGLFPLDTAGAADVATELDAVFGDTTEGPLAGVVRVVPIERLNAILVVSAQPTYLDQAQTWIDRLDRAGEGEEQEIYVYNVQNSRATNLSEVLGEIFAASTATVGQPSLLTPGQQPVELGSTSGFEIGAQQSQEQTGEGTQTGERAQPGRRPRTQARPLAAVAAFAQPASTRPESDIRIIADDTTNSLVIQARPREYRKIRQALEKLDVLPLQVLIEATIAEVTLNDKLNYGIEWFFRSGDFTFAQGAALKPASVFPGFTALFSSTDVRIVLNALEEVTDVDVISSPQLLVLDNQTARLQVGDQVPITTQQATSVQNPDAPIVNSVQLRDTGVILTVTPRVNSNGLVILEIQQEVSNVVGAETRTVSELTTPTISQRQISSTVAVQSGETVALGGLITDNRSRGSSGLPLLSRIPIIGALFGSKTNSSQRTELLVLLTPSVIGSQLEARAVTAELRRRMRGLDLSPPAEVPAPRARVPAPPAEIPLPPPPKSP